MQVPLQPMSSMAPMAALPNPILSAPAPAYYAGMNQAAAISNRLTAEVTSAFAVSKSHTMWSTAWLHYVN